MSRASTGSLALAIAVAALMAHASRAYAAEVTAPDGRGGTLVVWEENRRGTDHLYAQRLDAMGARLWPDTGAVVCGGNSNQLHPTVAADGGGGVIIGWIDDRGPHWRICVQRLDSTGVRVWGADGIVVAPNGGTIQYTPQLTTDGAGGTIVAWQADNGFDADIRAQRVDASGTPLWGAAGAAICTAQFFQWYPTLCSDGVGGAIIAWMDPRFISGTDWDIFAQRVNASGVVQWVADGVALCLANGRQDNPITSQDGSGGAIVVWEDQRQGFANADLYAQRIRPDGFTLWDTDGAPVSTASGQQILPRIALDGPGGAIVAWQDQRSGSEYDIYAQRLNPAGAREWTANDKALCTVSGNQLVATVASDDAGGAWVAWQDQRSGEFDVYVQHVTASSSVTLTPNGAPLSVANGNQAGALAMRDGEGGAVIAWLDSRAGDATLDVYAQRLDAVGANAWAANGTGVYVAPGIQLAPLALATSDGVVFAWKEKRFGEYDVVAQAFDADGMPRWASPLVLCGAPGNQAPGAIATDGDGGAIVAWTDPRAGHAATDIYAARVTDAGNLPWTPDGVAVCGATGSQVAPAIVADGAGGAVVAWQDGRVTPNDDVYAQHLDAAGAGSWASDGVAIGAAAGAQSKPAAVADDAGGAIIAWSDARAGASDANVYAQRVNGAGAAQWTANGVALGTAFGADMDAALIGDGSGGAIAAWIGQRGPIWRTFGQRVTALGATPWGPDGVGICGCDSLKTPKPPAIAPDGAGGAVVAFADKRDNGCVNFGCLDVYTQRVDGAGALLWGDGVGVGTSPGDQDDAHIVSDGAGGAIVTWRDFRSGARPDVFLQHLDGTGLANWLAGGVRADVGPMRRMGPALASDGSGGAYLAWQEQRDEYAWTLGVARFDATGARSWGGVTDVDPPAPSIALTLRGPWPNPSHGPLKVDLSLPRSGAGALELVDLAGRRVASRTLTGLAPGRHTLTLDGRSLASGLYFVRVNHDGHTITRKVCVLR